MVCFLLASSLLAGVLALWGGGSGDVRVPPWRGDERPEEGTAADAPRRGERAADQDGVPSDGDGGARTRGVSDAVAGQRERPGPGPAGEGGSHVLAHGSRGVPEVAGALLGGYREQGCCVLVSAGYADLFGRVWTCVVQGDGWVDVCELSATADGGCREAVTRMEAREWREEADVL